jgi:hypothetical protein
MKRTRACEVASFTGVIVGGIIGGVASRPDIEF